MVPYSVQDAAKRTKGATPLNEEVFDEENEGDLVNDVNEDDEDDITKDAMIKCNSKSKTSSSRSSAKKNPNTKIKGNTSKKQAKAKTKK